MSNTFINLESFWDNLLSREIQKIRDAYLSLSPQEKISIIAHLKRMETEPGWQAEQQISARVALEVIQDL